MRIESFDDRYRDDMIYMVLCAKDTMGQVPRLNNDLLDIRANYLDEGDMFWIALDDNDRVVGCLGFNRLNSSQIKLHRFFVKNSDCIVAEELLNTCEKYTINSGLKEITVHLSDLPVTFKSLFEKLGYVEYQPCWMKKII